MQNLEIKAWYPDLELARQILKNLCAEFVWSDQQVDTYFAVTHGRLKLRESHICGNELIFYQRSDAIDSKISDFEVYPTREPQLLKSVLTGSLGVRTIVIKSRCLYLWQRVRIHLDQVEKLGSFIEFEAPVDLNEPLEHAQEKVKSLLVAFGIEKQYLIARGYGEMLQKIEPGEQTLPD